MQFSITNPSDDASKPGRPRNVVWLLLKIALSVFILLGLFWRFRNEIPSLSTIDHWSAIEAIALLLLQPLLIGCRWSLLLRNYGSSSPLRKLIEATWVSVFANQFLPAGVGGDIIRIVYARRLGNSLSASTASILMDRIIALVALSLLILLLVPQLPVQIDRRIIVALGGCCGVGIIGLFGLFICVRRFSGAVRFPALKRVLHLTALVLRTLGYPVTMFLTILLSISVHILSFAAFFLIVRGLAIDVPVLPFLAVCALLTFIQIMPISIGGWGVREIAAVSLMGKLGIAPGPALLASIVVGLCYAVASLPGAVMWPFLTTARRTN